MNLHNANNLQAIPKIHDKVLSNEDLVIRLIYIKHKIQKKKKKKKKKNQKESPKYFGFTTFAYEVINSAVGSDPCLSILSLPLIMFNK